MRRLEPARGSASIVAFPAMPPPHHHPPHHDAPPPPKPHWASMEQMPDEDVLRYAPPEIRRLWRKLAAVENTLATVQAQQAEILQLLRAHRS